MNRKSSSYTFLFAFIICVVCSLALSLVAEGLRPRKELNVALDIKKNILKAVNLREPLSEKASAEDVLRIYDEKIRQIVMNAKGEVVEGQDATEVETKLKENTQSATSMLGGETLFPVYIYEEDGVPQAYAFPIIGKGLWSTLYGYFALESDAVTVRGITFYQHGETPGLGAEIEKDWFQQNYVGKKIWDVDAQELRPVQVVKGKVTDTVPEGDQAYYVDGISGATMTSNGVSEMVGRWLKIYQPFFKSVRTGEPQ